MAGYTRQSVADIINGANITAPPLNAEFNQLLAAFNSSTGHTHDGSTGSAPKLPLTTSVSGYLPVVHGGVGGRNNTTATADPATTNDNTEGYAPGSIWINANTGYTHMCLFNTTNNANWVTIAAISNTNIIAPKATNTVDLGTSTLQFKNIYVDGVGYIDDIDAETISSSGNTDVGGLLTVTGNATVGGTFGVTGLSTLASLGVTTTLTVGGSVGITGATIMSGNLTVNGNTVIGNAASDTVTVTADVASNLIPSADSTYDLGATGSEWRDLYIDGTAKIDALEADTANIDGGSVDGTSIGAGTPSSGSFAGLTATGTVNLSGATVSNLGAVTTADINGGTVDGVTIGTNSAVTDLRVDNLKVDGNAITSTNTNGNIDLTPAGTGEVNISKVDINSGAIDNTVIGATTAVAGSFTTVSTSGQATLATVDINGGAIDGTAIGGSSASSGAFTTVTASGGFSGAISGNVTGNVSGNLTGDVTGDVTGDLTGNVTASSGSSTFTNVVVNGTLNMNAGTTATIENLTAPTNANDAATKAYVDGEISTLIGDAGAGLNTLGELADALNDDDDFSATVTASIATKLPKAGGTMSGVIAMGSNKITGVTDPTANQDASTKAYTDAQRDTRVAKSGDTMSGALAMGSNKITGLGTPTAGTDATTKTYVDTIHGSAVAAATSATNASNSQTAAANSASAALASKNAALVSQNAAAASYDLFDDRFLGAKSSAPTQDNDGGSLVVGTLYFDTTAQIMKVYGASGWQSAGSAVNGTSERYKYVATNNQTTFTGADANSNALGYDAGFLDVFLSGIRLVNGTDFTATSGTSIQLASGAATGDILEVVTYGTFVLSNQSITDMTDVNTGGVSTNDILAYNGTNFVPIDNPTLGSVTATSLKTTDFINIQVDDAQLYFTNAANNRYNLFERDASNNFYLKHFDGSSVVTDLTFNSAGAATFSSDVHADSFSLNDDKYMFFGTSDDARIHFDGTDSLYITCSNGTADKLKTNANTTMMMQANGNQLFTMYANNEVVVNEDSNDINFRVESNNQTHMLFVDGGNNRVGVGGVVAPSDVLQVHSGAAGRSIFRHASGDGGVTITGSGSGSAASLVFGNNWDNDAGSNFVEEYRLYMDGADDSLKFKYNANQNTALTLSNAGKATFSSSVFATNFNFTTAPNYAGTSLGIYNSGTWLNTSANTTGFLGVGGSGMLSWHTGGVNLVGSVIINEAGADADFRVESNNRSHMLFVDASADGVGIGDGSVQSNGLRISSSTGTTNAVDTKLYLNARSSGTTTTGFGPGIVFAGDRNGDSGTQQMAQINAVAEVNSGTTLSSGLQFQTATSGVNSEKMRIQNDGKIRLGNIGDHVMVDVTGSNAALQLIDNNQSNPPTLRGNGPNFTIENQGFNRIAAYDGSTVINDDGRDQDFRVESDANSNALFLDAEKNVVSLGTNAINSAFVDNQYVGLQIGTPGVDNFGGHMFMSQTAPQNEWMDIIGVHDKNATGVYFTIHIVRTGDQNRSYSANVRYAYNQAFTLITVSQQNTVVEYRVTNANVLQYRVTTAGPYFVNLTVMSAG